MSEDHWNRRKEAIRRGQRMGGVAGARAAERVFNARPVRPSDLIGSEYGYHCENCFKDLDYGEEVNKDGTILCKDCARMTEKAKGTGEIVCSAWAGMGEGKRRCPKHPRGHRYRGVNKCWGCPHATWQHNGKPYGVLI